MKNLLLLPLFHSLVASLLLTAEEPTAPKAFLDKISALPGWKMLGKKDFAQVNCDPETFQFGDPGSVHCTGKPHGGLRTAKSYKNFEVAFEWRHNKHAGNAGVFLWCPRSVLDKLPRGRLPQGIEVQILDLGYEENHFKKKGKHSNWFTSHGDVFPVGVGRMKAATPEVTYKDEKGNEYKVGKPNSARSFPTKRLTRPKGKWNHYYIQAEDGTVKLWVNGEKVNEGRECTPNEGHFVLESEGAPVDFRGMKLRELK